MLECLLLVLYRVAHRKTARRASRGPDQLFRPWRVSLFRLALKDSAAALSALVPTAPRDLITPRSAQTCAKSVEAYWVDSIGRRNTLIVEVLRGKTRGVDDDVDGTSGDTFAGQPPDPSRYGAHVLGEDRRGTDQRGRCRSVRRVGSGRFTVVPRACRHAVDPAHPAIGQISILRGT